MTKAKLKAAQRLCVAIDTDLAKSLAERQRQIQAQTGLRPSMSQLAASVLRCGLLQNQKG